MAKSFRIRAVTVNHNSSHFTELMLRSLFAGNDLRDLDFALTVLDNHSDDEHLASLRSYLAQQGIPLVQTGFDSSLAPEKHGAGLSTFVLENGDCTHYLFLDSDIWFPESQTIPTMVAELAAAPPSSFASQARVFGYYAGRIIEGRDGIPGAGDWEVIPTWDMPVGAITYVTAVAPRCSPACCLVSNTPIFRTVVDAVGLGRAMIFGVGKATFYDTFGLMTRVMATHGLSFIVSSRTVNHFTEAGYRPDLRTIKDRDCLRLLKEFKELMGDAPS